MKRTVLLLILLLSLVSGIFSQSSRIFYDRTVKVEVEEGRKLKSYGLIDTLTGDTIVKPCYTTMQYQPGNRFISVAVGKKWGMIDAKGKQVLPLVYNFVRSYHGNVIIAGMPEGHGMLDTNGKVLIPFEFSSINDSDLDFAILFKEEKMGACYYSGEIFLPVEYDRIRVIPQYIEIKKNELYGLYSRSGKKLLETKHTFISFKNDSIKQLLTQMGEQPLYDTLFWNGPYSPFKVGLNTKFGLLEVNGKVAVPIIYDKLTIRNNYLVEVEKNNAVGVLRLNGEAAHPLQYHTSYYFRNNYILKVGESCEIYDPKLNLILKTDYEKLEPHNDVYLVAYKNHKYSLINYKTGEYVSANQYDDLSVGNLYQQGLTITNNEGRYGVMNAAGKEIVPPVYYYLPAIRYNHVILKNENGAGVIDMAGKIVIPFDYQSLKWINDHVLETRINRKYGLINMKGEELLPAIYDELYLINEDYISSKSGKKQGIITVEGKELIPPLYNHVWCLTDGLFTVQVKKRYGIVDTNHVLISSIKFDSAPKHVGQFIAVRKGKKYGLMDSSARLIKGFEYEDFKLTVNDIAALLTSQNTWEFYDSKGQLLHKGDYQDLRYFSKAFIAVKSNGKWGIINKQFNLKINAEYDTITALKLSTKARHNYSLPIEYFQLSNNGKYGLIDSNCRKLLDCVYDSLLFGRFDGLVLYKSNGLIGMYSVEQEKILAGPEFEEIGIFNEGLVSARKNGSWGVISSSAETMIPFRYDNILEIRGDNFILVEQNGKKGMVKVGGEEIILPEYDDIRVGGDGFFKVRKNGKQGWLDFKGKVMLEVKYDNISMFGRSVAPNRGLIIEKLNGEDRLGVIDKNGKIIIPVKFERIEASHKGFIGVLDGKGYSYDYEGNLR